MADSFAGYTEPAVPSKKLDADAITTTAGPVLRQRTADPAVLAAITDSDFAALSLAGKGYALSAAVTVAASVETDLLLFRNLSPTKLVRLYEQVVSIPDSAQTVRCVIRVYKNPTIVGAGGGAALGIGGLRDGQPVSGCAAASLPTALTPVNRGTLVQIYGVVNTPTQRMLALSRYVEPLASLLVTAQPSSAGTLHGFGQSWAEV